MANDELTPTSVARTLGVDLEAGPRPARRRRRLLWAMGALVAAAAGVAWSRADGGSAVQYRTMPVERGELRVTVTATGTLEPTNTVEVGSEVSGTIVQVLADEDDHVMAGQVLARIDPTKLEAQARQLEAALASAEARLLQARATREESATQLRRLQQLHEAKLSSQQDLDAQRATAERGAADEASAQAAVSQARATLQTVRTDLAKAVIRSPIEGVVLTPAADGRSFISRLMPGPPRRPSGNGNGALAENGKGQRVWVLKGGAPLVVPIEIGATDGRRTLVVSGDVTPGQELVVETAGKE